MGSEGNSNSVIGPAPGLGRVVSALAGKYRVERELGRGGMAVVYLAEDLRHRRPAAIKVVDSDLAQAIGAERFLREIAIAARLSHPNILPVHDSGVADGLLYYVMPLAEGESLRERLSREKQLPIDEALAIADDVAKGIEYAHAHGVVHRDIKPENILLHAGQAVVCDFGIARAIGSADADRLTQTGVSVGTPSYMSPEQATGGAVDTRTDIYSLGCVLYEMLAGMPPHVGANPQAIIARKIVDAVPSVRVVRDTVPPALEGVLKRALAKTPADRFATVGELRKALRSSSIPIASPPNWRARPQAFAALTGIFILGAATYFVAKQREWLATGIDSVAVLPFDNLSRDAEQEYFVAGMHEALISELATIDALRVISRTSTLRFRNSDKPLSEIARELDVDAIVEGSTLKAGDSVRINVQLIQARPREQHLWTRAYDRSARSVLAMHADVARDIAKQIRINITPAERRRLTTVREVDPLAYEHYLRGLYARRNWSPAGLDSAENYFRRSVDRDPTFAKAHVALAAIWAGRSGFGILSAEDAFRRAEPSIQRALELDSTIVEARLMVASIREWQHDWAASDREYRRALAIDPNNSQVHGVYAVFLAGQNRPREAAQHAARAVDLDPLAPAHHAQHGVVSIFARRLDDAEHHYREALRLGGEHTVARWGLWSVYHLRGNFPAAVREAKAYFAAVTDSAVVSALERGWVDGGYTAALRRAADVLERRSRTRYVRPHWPLAIYAQLGDTTRALHWLERMVAARDRDARHIAVMPATALLRNHPRFKTLLRRMNLGDAAN